MKTVQGDGVQLAYEERGKGPAVVLIAGGFLDMEQWDAQIAALSASYRVIRFDHRGVGESDKPVASYSIGISFVEERYCSHTLLYILETSEVTVTFAKNWISEYFQNKI